MKIRSLLAGFLLCLAFNAHAATEIVLWHAMGGALGRHLNSLIDQFNASQKDYKVVAAYKGGYDETLAAARTAWRQGTPPDIVQVVDVATMDVMMEKGMVKPLYRLMVETHTPFEAGSFVPAVSSFYSDTKGNLMSLPFNISTPVFYFSKDAFKKAGLDVNTPLKTWYDVQAAGLKIQETQSAQCGLTTTYPSWIMLENVLAWHDEEFASKDNGFDGPDAALTFNTKLAMRHMALLASWVKARIFTYAGRGDEGERKFIAGECAMLTSSSGSYANILRDAKFQWGVMPMPHYDDFADAPFNTTMGGGSLWALAGKKTTAKEYKGMALLLAFLAKPEIQAQWSETTGYLPVSRAAYDLIRNSGFYDKFPGTDVGVRTITNKSKPGPYSRGVRLGDYERIRALIDKEIEDIWEDKKMPKAGLDEAVQRGNELLRRWERTYKN